jgi:uncharacterized protein YceK
MGMRTKMRYVIVSCLVCGAVLLSACSSARKAGAGAALPFAALGDTMLLPFQGLGYASDKLIEQGDEHLATAREQKRGNVTLRAAEDTSAVLYVPGYALWPFAQITPDGWYPMTSTCLAALKTPEDEAGAAEPQGAPASAPSKEFIEF